MTSFPYHKPVCWELFRNEPLETQNRRAAIAKSRALVNRDRKPLNGLWWDAQKHVDQVVPAEFINPSEVDTNTYRYQVFARPPPIQCPMRSLQEATDATPPIRYNVKRVAVDKPFPPASFECAGHWSRRPFMVQRNVTRGSGGHDCSKNNNTLHVTLSKEAPHNKSMGLASFVEKDTGTSDCRGGNNGQKTQGKDLPNIQGLTRLNVSSSPALVKEEAQSTSKNYELLDENNSRSLRIPVVSDNPRSTKSRASLSVVPTESALRVNSPGCVGVLSDTKAYPKSPSGPFTPRKSESRASRDPRSNISNHAVRSPSCAKHSAENVPDAHNRSLVKIEMPKECPSNSSLCSRAASICSVSTLPSFRSARQSPMPKGYTLSHASSPLSNVQTNRSSRSQKAQAKASHSRDSVASLLSERDPLSVTSPPPRDVGMGRRKFLSQPISSQESVASLLSDSNQNNHHGVLFFAPGTLQDEFAELFEPALTQAGISLDARVATNWSEIHDDDDDDGDFLPAETITASQFFVYKDAKGESPEPQCRNNNASTQWDNKSGRYILQCCPVQSCGADGVRDKRKMLCKFRGKQPRLPSDHPHVQLDQVKPLDPASGRVKWDEKPQEFECRALTSCATGKPLEDAGGGPVMVCEPKRPSTPEVGYGTYKIVGGVQRRAAPPADIAAELSLPPHLEEYREFTKRCPNFQMGRYDRRDPLNEMLLPSNKSTTLLGGAKVSPFTYCRMPKRNLPPLFEPQKTSSDLTWSLPAFVVNQ